MKKKRVKLCYARQDPFSRVITRKGEYIEGGRLDSTLDPPGTSQNGPQGVEM